MRIRIPTGFDIEHGCTSAEVSEAAALCASPIACAVADAWVPIAASGLGMDRALAEVLDALECATRTSPLRKVSPLFESRWPPAGAYVVARYQVEAYITTRMGVEFKGEIRDCDVNEIPGRYLGFRHMGTAERAEF